MKPLYGDLTKEEELSKCFHDLTQNANDSFNAMIWERGPKANYCGLNILKLCVYDAIASFNYGGKATLGLYILLHMKAGYFTNNICKQLHHKREYVSGYRNMESSKKRRKIIHGNKKRE